MSRIIVIVCLGFIFSTAANARNAGPGSVGRIIHLVCNEAFVSTWLGSPPPIGEPLNPDIHFITIDLRNNRAVFDKDPNYKVTTPSPIFFQIDKDVSATADHELITIDRRNGFFDILNTENQAGKVVEKSQVFGICGTEEPKF